MFGFNSSTLAYLRNYHYLCTENISKQINMDVKRIMKQKGITFETLAAKMGQTKGTLSASIGKDGNLGDYL